MTRKHNLRTRRIYESMSAYELDVEYFDRHGRPAEDPFNVKSEFGNSFVTYDDPEEAINQAKVVVKDIKQSADNGEYGYGIESSDFVDTENDDQYQIVLDGGRFGKWIFSVYDNANECGDNCEKDVDECGENLDEDDDMSECQESVAERFARLRKMFESDDVMEDEDEDQDEDETKQDDDSSDSDKNDSDEDSDNDKDDDSDEDEEMKAVILTVKKGDADKCKEELTDAGIAEEDIEIIEGDEDSENDEVRVDVNSIMELKDYLNTKGIDLEEEIGGEIVSDEDEDSEEDEDSDEKGDEEDDIDFDNLGDIFGAEEGDEDEK